MHWLYALLTMLGLSAAYGHWGNDFAQAAAALVVFGVPYLVWMRNRPTSPQAPGR